MTQGATTPDPPVQAKMVKAKPPQMRLTPQQQIEALRRIQTQAEHRVKLGMQLFKAAEAHTSHQSNLLEQLKHDLDRQWVELKRDMAEQSQRSLRWLERIDDHCSTAMQKLDAKLDTVYQTCRASEKRIESLVIRAETLLAQSLALVDAMQDRLSSVTATRHPQSTEAPQDTSLDQSPPIKGHSEGKSPEPRGETPSPPVSPTDLQQTATRPTGRPRQPNKPPSMIYTQALQRMQSVRHDDQTDPHKTGLG